MDSFIEYPFRRKKVKLIHIPIDPIFGQTLTKLLYLDYDNIIALRSQYSKSTKPSVYQNILRTRKVDHYLNSLNWTHVAYKPTEKSQTYTLHKLVRKA